MKVNMHGVDLELTPQEYVELAKMLGAYKEDDKIDVRNLSFEDELNLLYSLKYFEVVETEMSSFGTIKVTLRSDLS